MPCFSHKIQKSMTTTTSSVAKELVFVEYCSSAWADLTKGEYITVLRTRGPLGRTKLPDCVTLMPGSILSVSGDAVFLGSICLEQTV